MKKFKAMVLLFAFVALFVGGIGAVSVDSTDASRGCCIWVMYCPVVGPGPCWCKCVPVPCP